jgi:hypothetical protein
MKSIQLLFLSFVVASITISKTFAGGLLLQFGPSYNGIRHPTFEIFRKNYNAFEAAGIKIPLNKLANTNSFQYALGWNSNGFYSTIGRNKYRSVSEAIGNTGDKRSFDFNCSSTLWEIGVLTSLSDLDRKYKFFTWGAGMCFSYNKIILGSSYTSSTGFQDFGTGSRLNGFFINTDMDYLLMAQMGLNIYKGISIVGKAYYNVMNHSINAPALVDHQQDDQVQLYGPAWIRIPTDYSTAVINDLDTRLIFPKDGSLLQTNMNQYHLQLSVYIPLSKKLFKSSK